MSTFHKKLQLNENYFYLYFIFLFQLVKLTFRQILKLNEELVKIKRAVK